MFSLIWFLLIGLCAGWLAGMLTSGGSFGVKGNLLVGVVGALVGGLLVRILGFAPTGLRGELLSATIGAIAFLIALGRWSRRGA